MHLQIMQTLHCADWILEIAIPIDGVILLCLILYFLPINGQKLVGLGNIKRFFDLGPKKIML